MNPGGVICAFAFLSTKGLSWLTGIYNNYSSMRYQDKEDMKEEMKVVERELEEAKQERLKESELIGSTTTEAELDAQEEAEEDAILDKGEMAEKKLDKKAASVANLVAWALIN